MKLNLLLLIGLIINLSLCLKFQIISDRQQIPTSSTPQCFLLTLTPNSINQLTRQWKENAKNLQFLSWVYIGVLGANKKLQKSFNVKRYPFLGCRVQIEGQQYFYGMPDIVTSQSASSFLVKVFKYHEYTTINYRKRISSQIKAINKKYQSQKYHRIQVHIPVQLIHQNLAILFKKLYYPIDLVLTTSSQTILIIDPHSIEFYLQSLNNLTNMLKVLSLSVINQFSSQAYQQLNPKTKIFMLILDSIHKRQSSLQMKRQIEQLLLKNLVRWGDGLIEKEPEYYIFWMQSALNQDKKVYLGFEKQCDPPLLGQFILDSPQNKNIYPSEINLTASSALHFIIQTAYSRQSDAFYTQFVEELKMQKLNTAVNKYGRDGIYMENREFKEGTLLFLVSDPFGYPINSECIDVTLPVQRLKNIHALVGRVNKFTRVSSYLENKEIDKYKIVVIVGFPLPEGLCLSYYLQTNQTFSLFNEMPIFSEQTLISMFSKIQNLPHLWWVPQNKYQMYLEAHPQ